MTGVDHIGIAVPNLDEALRFWRDQLGMELQGIEVVPSDGVRVAILNAGGTRVELLEPLSPESPVGRHLERRGPGIHHLALRVDDLPSTMAALKAAGRPPLDDRPRPGASDLMVTFLHPRNAGGVLVELTEPGAGRGHS